jgi:hypothetical protein
MDKRKHSLFVHNTRLQPVKRNELLLIMPHGLACLRTDMVLVDHVSV